MEKAMRQALEELVAERSAGGCHESLGDSFGLQLARSTLATTPTCVWCGEPFDHGCNTALCSEACEQESALAHERAHAGISDPDQCEDMGTCPLMDATR